MSDIIRCDKCKEELPQKVVKKKRLFGLLKGEYKEKYYSAIYEGSYTHTETFEFHICGKCFEKFKLWLDE